MLRLFQTGSIKRLPYVLAVLALLAFDFAKDPIEQYLERTAGGMQSQIVAGDPQLDAHFRDLADRMQQRVPSQEPRPLTMSPAEAAADAATMAGKQIAVSTAYVSALVALGLVTLVAIIWLVFARVRDIGWPVWVGFAVLSLPLFLRLFGTDVPATLFYLLQGIFALSLLGLGLVASGAGAEPPSRPLGIARPLQNARPVRGEFGRRS